MKKNTLSLSILTALLSGTIINPAIADENGETNTAGTLSTVYVTDTAGDTITNAVILDEQELEKSTASSPHQLLKDIPGVEFKKGAGGLFRNIRMRGMGTGSGDGDRVAINLDGIPVSSSFQYGHATDNGQSSFDVADLKAVDVKKGAAAVNSHSSGIAGTVNFVTKDPEDYIIDGNDFGGNVRAGYNGQDDSYSGGVSVAGQFTDSFSGMLSYTYRNFHEIENYDGKDVVGTERSAKNPTDGTSNNILSKLVFTPNANNTFKLRLENFDANSDTLVLDKAQSAEKERFDKFESNRQSIGLSHHFNAQNAVFDSGKWQLYVQDSEQNRNNEFQSYSSRSKSVSATHTKYNVDEIGFETQLKKTIGNNELSYGIKLRETDVKTRLVYQSPGSTRPYQTQPDTTTKNYSVFVNDTISLAGGKATLLPGIEYTHYTIEPEATNHYFGNTKKHSDGAVSWSLGSTFDINDHHQAFASYRQGVKVPSFLEQNPGAVFAHGTQYIPNPSLKPEKSKTLELGVRSIGTIGSQTVSVFHDTYQNFIEGKNYPDLKVNQNINNPNDITIYGIEYQGELELGELGMADGLKLKGGLTYTKAREGTDNGKVPYSDADPLNGHIAIAYDSPSEKWGTEMTTYFAQGKSVSDINPADLNARYGALKPIGGYGVTNLTAYFRPIDNMQINAGVYNLFDKKYALWSESQASDAYYQKIPYENLTEPGRTFGVNFKYDF